MLATHEAGHAVCCLNLPARPADRAHRHRRDVVGAIGYVRPKQSEHKHYRTVAQMMAEIVVCFGGVEAEKLLLNAVSLGLESDLDRATGLAKAIVEAIGAGGEETGVGRYTSTR